MPNRTPTRGTNVLVESIRMCLIFRMGILTNGVMRREKAFPASLQEKFIERYLEVPEIRGGFGIPYVHNEMVDPSDGTVTHRRGDELTGKLFCGQ